MTRPNPFAPAPAAKSKPAGMTKSDGEMIARVLAKEMHAAIQPLNDRITSLEKALEFAMSEAATAAEKYLQTGDDD